MTVFTRIISLLLLLTLAASPCFGASKVGFLESILRHGKDVANLGKKVGKLAPEIRASLIRKYPRLEKASDDLVRGVFSIEKTTSKNASASRMIEQGVNPVKVATLTSRSPKTVEAGDKIAKIFEGSRATQKNASLPAPAVAALRKTGGNYREAGEQFLVMERRGGARAVNMALKLSEYVNMKNAVGATALGLLAWHMADPAGANEAVESFFRDHVAPLVAAPVKGMVDAGGNAIKESLDSAASQAEEIGSQYWPFLLVCGLLMLPIFVPNLRRTPFIWLNSLAGRLNSKLENRVSHHEMHKPQQEQGKKINIYKK